MTRLPDADDGSIVVDFCGESTSVDPLSTLTVGREADITIDDNPFLHRVFLAFAQQSGIWLVSNVGTQLSATVANADGQVEAFLGPGASLPLVFSSTVVSFTAGPTSYELTITNPTAAYRAPTLSTVSASATTVGPTSLTRDQRLLIVALAEPRLARRRTGFSRHSVVGGRREASGVDEQQVHEEARQRLREAVETRGAGPLGGLGNSCLESACPTCRIRGRHPTGDPQRPGLTR